MGDRRLGWVVAALLLSAAIHGVVLGLPGWTLPGPEGAEPPILNATLVAAPRPALSAPPAAKPSVPRPAVPRPPAPARPRTAEAAPVPAVAVPEAAEAPAGEAPTPPPLEPAPSAPPVDAPPAPASPLVPAGPAWPREGRIVYDVFRGEQNFLVGQTAHSWEQDGQRYRMQAVVETTGLVALMRSFRYVQTSEGRVTARGLVPERFRVDQEGRRPESAEFHWDAAEAVVRRNKGPERRGALRPGDQDVLSIWHQLALMGEPPPHLRLSLVSNKSVTPSELETVGMDVLTLPLGHVVAHHLRARALDNSLSLDIWLAEKFGYLPVRILVTDRQGETYDQRAREVFRGDEPTAGPSGNLESKSDEQ